MLSLLRMRLHHTIELWRAAKTVIADKCTSPAWEKHATSDLMAQAIPLKRIGNATSMRYACAIAHQLAVYPDQAVAIAAQLVETLQQDLTNHQEPTLQGINVQATATGFIHFEVSDRAIAAWLDLLLANAQPPRPFPVIPLSETDRQLMLQASVLFEVQHAHARCCSLLRLAHHEALIYVDSLEASPQNWRFRNPATVFWLTSNDQLQIQHLVDRTLIAALLDAYDLLFDPFRQQTQSSVVRSAHTVAQAFQAFHRAHPLWEKAQDNSTITVARLGLLMITQRVLHLLLWNGLNLCPALEL